MMRIGAGGLGLGLAQASRASAAATSGRILVVFAWFGGNDGLNTIA